MQWKEEQEKHRLVIGDMEEKVRQKEEELREEQDRLREMQAKIEEERNRRD